MFIQFSILLYVAFWSLLLTLGKHSLKLINNCVCQKYYLRELGKLPFCPPSPNVIVNWVSLKAMAGIYYPLGSFKCMFTFFHKNWGIAPAGVAQWTECQHASQTVAGWLSVRVHAWIAGQVSSRWHVKGNWSVYLSHIDVSLPLFFPSLPLSLKINK